MSEWIQHNGKGVPPDAIPGVTVVRLEAFPGHPFISGEMLIEKPWSGKVSPWHWDSFGKDTINGGLCARVIAYRNPSTDTAVEALKAIAANPKRKFREAVET